ncbi:ABC transporter substrate-binding protein [Alteromonadaceae bacterium M269]|nr:ABC transporter substrate-binding protein [Alteromonadaceae bacterium M269]
MFHIHSQPWSSLSLLKGIVLSAILLVSTMASSQVRAESDNPYILLQEVAAVTFERIKRERDDIEQNPELLRAVIEEELLPYIDYKFSALKVLGKNLKSVPREKVPEFIQVFREYLITTYALALTYYDDQEVVFEPVKEITNERIVTVRVLIKDKDAPDIKVAFKVRKNKKTNKWKAYDMIAEGISLLSSKQSELESVVRQKGIDTVIELLREKNKQPITLERS